MFTVAGIMAALLAREKTGRGQYVDVSMTDGVLALMASLFSAYQISGKPPRRAGQPTNGATPYYNVYECADGKYISLGVVEPRFWEELCKGLDRPDLLPLQDKTEEYPRIRDEFTRIFKQRTRDEWWDHLKHFDICLGKVLDFEELADDPQLQARGMILEVQDEQGNTYRQVSSAFNLSDTPPTIRRLAPERGAHTDEALAQAGFSADEIARLRRDGTVA
ncbi:MAG TPA: CaiB/BaiF CoA-transferase family protein, partial [Dehalococcoidia bacterium]|nr:CaiB/BaiF CoA-transferase family protein [Dehalococcoidia bacterium]